MCSLFWGIFLALGVSVQAEWTGRVAPTPAPILPSVVTPLNPCAATPVTAPPLPTITAPRSTMSPVTPNVTVTPAPTATLTLPSRSTAAPTVTYTASQSDPCEPGTVTYTPGATVTVTPAPTATFTLPPCPTAAPTVTYTPEKSGPCEPGTVTYTVGATVTVTPARTVTFPPCSTAAQTVTHTAPLSTVPPVDLTTASNPCATQRLFGEQQQSLASTAQTNGSMLMPAFMAFGVLGCCCFAAAIGGIFRMKGGKRSTRQLQFSRAELLPQDDDLEMPVE